MVILVGTALTALPTHLQFNDDQYIAHHQDYHAIMDINLILKNN